MIGYGLAAALIAGLFIASSLLGQMEPGGTQLQLSLLLGAAFGIVLQRGRFCFLCIWRDWLDHRDPRGILAILTALAIGTVGYTLIFGAWLPNPSGPRLPPTAHIGPVGPVLVLAGLAFGAGMAISGSCISAHIYRLGEGSPTAPFALVGAAIGFGLGFLSWNSLYLASISESPVVWLSALFGYGGALVLTLALIAGLASFFLWRGQPQPAASASVPHGLDRLFVERWPPIVTGLIVGIIGVAAYLRLSPLGVTAELGARSRQAAGALGVLPGRLEGLDAFRGCATLVRDALLTPNGVFVAGIAVASFASALAAGAFKPQRPRIQHAVRGLLGGSLLGFGAMIGLGCTVGTLLSGIMAGALSGWVFLVSLVAGTTVTLRLMRPLQAAAIRPSRGAAVS